MAITNISFSIGTLAPTFSSGTSSYEIFVASTAGSTVNITVTSDNGGDVLSINGTTVSSGVPFSYTLPNGSASISINVTGATTFGYAITLFRTFTIPYSGLLTPPQVAVAYGLSLPTASSGSGYKVGIINSNDDFLQSDLNSSFAALIAAGLLPAGTVAPTIIRSNPGNRPLTVYTEPTQDIYSVAAMVPGATIISYQRQANSFGTTAEIYAELAARIIADAVDVVSFSYGWGGPTDNAFFAALDAAKIPFFYATEDYGAFNMDSNDADYPSRIANSIAVGGTNLALNTDNTRSSEIAESYLTDSFYANRTGWGSPGSTSTVAALPSFQSGLSYTPYNTTTGAESSRSLTRRGVPDISGPMNGYVMYYKGNIVRLGGTSSAAPILAGFIVRIMEATKVRKSSTEWNQFFYSTYSSNTFYDITSGNNATGISGDGYIATAGWDAVTGLGTPIGSGLITAINSTFPRNTGTVIYSANFNAIQSIAADIRGLGENGYGLTASSPTVVGSLISAERANRLLSNISTVYKHITNITTATTTVTNTSTSTSIVKAKFFNDIKYMADYCLANRYSAHSSQLVVSVSTSSTRTLPWGANGTTSIIHKVRVVWATRLSALYYFNQGNYLSWVPDYESTPINDLDVEWATWINYIVATPGQEFRYNRSNFVAGSITTRNYSSGTLRINVIAVKSPLETAVDFSITYQNVDNPLLVVVPAGWAYRIDLP